jgi:hypothetical protein
LTRSLPGGPDATEDAEERAGKKRGGNGDAILHNVPLIAVRPVQHGKQTGKCTYYSRDYTRKRGFDNDLLAYMFSRSPKGPT